MPDSEVHFLIFCFQFSCLGSLASFHCIFTGIFSARTAFTCLYLHYFPMDSVLKLCNLIFGASNIFIEIPSHSDSSWIRVNSDVARILFNFTASHGAKFEYPDS